jgi:hypothetical protein
VADLELPLLGGALRRSARCPRLLALDRIGVLFDGRVWRFPRVLWRGPRLRNWQRTYRVHRKRPIQAGDELLHLRGRFNTKFVGQSRSEQFERTYGGTIVSCRQVTLDE